MSRQPPQAASGPMVRAVQLGTSGFALVGLGLALDTESVPGFVLINLTVVGGRESTIVGLTPVQVTIAELGRIPVDDLVAKLIAKEKEIAGDALAEMPRAQG